MKDTYEEVTLSAGETPEVGVTLLVKNDADGTYAAATADQIAAGGTFYKQTATAAPGVADKKPFNASAYYQIYDVDVYEGNASLRSRRQNVQPYGMDYSWTLIARNRYGVHAPLYGQFYGSPNFPAVNGSTTMVNTVAANADLAGNDQARALAAMGLKVADAAAGNYNDALKRPIAADGTKGAAQPLYAATGTHAVMRKPLVRVWNTVSDSLPRPARPPTP